MPMTTIDIKPGLLGEKFDKMFTEHNELVARAGSAREARNAAEAGLAQARDDDDEAAADAALAGLKDPGATATTKAATKVEQAQRDVRVLDRAVEKSSKAVADAIEADREALTEGLEGRLETARCDIVGLLEQLQRALMVGDELRSVLRVVNPDRAVDRRGLAGWRNAIKGLPGPQERDHTVDSTLNALVTHFSIDPRIQIASERVIGGVPAHLVEVGKVA